jgi:2-hydroxy-3-oxopropionate reductase
MVGGDAADFEAAKPVLNTFGSTIAHVGPSGAGQVVKAANQLLVAGTLGLVAEALVFLDAQDVDAEAAIKVLSGGLASGRILELKAANMAARPYGAGIPVDLHHKDLGIVTAAARDAGVAIPLGATAAQRTGASRAQGTVAWTTARCTSSSRRCLAGGRRERQPCRRAGPAPQPQRRPGTPARVKPSGTTPTCQGSARFPREMEERND